MAHGKEIFEVRPDGIYVEFEGIGKFFKTKNYLNKDFAKEAAEVYLAYLKRFTDPILSIGAIQNTLNHFGYLIDLLTPTFRGAGSGIKTRFTIWEDKQTIVFMFGSMLVTVDNIGRFSIDKYINDRLIVKICINVPVKLVAEILLYSEDNHFEGQNEPVMLYLNQSNRRFLNEEFRRLI